MKALSSSRLRLVQERCPGALDLAEDNAPYDASMFAVGKVAHAALDALHAACKRAGRALTPEEASEVAHATSALLATQGSRFDGASEAPVSIDAVREGVDLALSHLLVEGMAIDPDAHPEMGLGVDSEWRPMPYTTATHWRGVLDLIGLYEDEDGANVLWVRDYKSAWTTGPTAPQTLQMRGQALLALAHASRLFPGIEIHIVRREVVNLRTHATHEESLDLADADHILDAWRAEIDAFVRAIPERPRPFRPGPQCAGCPYRLPCRVAPPEATDIAATAARYAALKAEAEALEPILRAATDDASLTLDGYVLGWHTKSRAKPAKNAHRRLAELFATDKPDEGLVGLIAQIVGVSGIRSAVKALHPDGRATDRADALLAELIAHTNASEWAFKRTLDPEAKEKV